MKAVDKAAQILGWTFIASAVVVLLRPNTPLRDRIDGAISDIKVRAIVADEWDLLVAGDAVLGSRDKRLRIVEFVDYTCHYCRRFHEAAVEFLTKHSDTGIRVRHLPPPGNTTARAAAVAAICAASQGQFSDMHAYLLTDTTWYRSKDWDAVARDVGLDDERSFRSCQGSDDALVRLRQDSAWAHRLNIRATPALIVRDHGVHLGTVQAGVLAEWLDLGR